MSRDRSRVEFKGRTRSSPDGLSSVEIEAEWNLKVVSAVTGMLCGIVEIEAEWNLKKGKRTGAPLHRRVEIEAEWNLKMITAS